MGDLALDNKNKLGACVAGNLQKEASKMPFWDGLKTKARALAIESGWMTPKFTEALACSDQSYTRKPNTELNLPESPFKERPVGIYTIAVPRVGIYETIVPPHLLNHKKPKP
jgi:hypothetical protein